MPLAYVIDFSNFAAWVIFGVLLVAVFLFGRERGRGRTPSPAFPSLASLPTRDDLIQMERAANAVRDATDAVAGWKAAIYGAVGVVLGAAGGLASDYVINGSMSASEIGRLAILLVVLVAVVAAFVFLVERSRVVERFVGRHQPQDLPDES
jgi:drug/metabolite transporter (DMT)-like permease